jgi:hypothetical protein
MAAGSCNTLTSVMLGLSRNPKNLRTLFTLGVGPSKLAWLHERLALLGVDTEALPFAWQHFSLHDTGYSQYGQHFTGETYNGIEFHPTYEAKIWRWLKTPEGIARLPYLYAGDVGFWIVGGPVKPAVLASYYTRRV